MNPWEAIDTAPIPGGTGELRLMRRGGDFSIFVGRDELMNSRLSGSEEALAVETCRRLSGPKPRLLIGGLGMGFTLRAALAVLAPNATVVVAELVPAVVAWARGPLASVFAGSLDDPRVGIVEEDVAVAMRDGPWDAILLDVDNGPTAWCGPETMVSTVREGWPRRGRRCAPVACSRSGPWRATRLFAARLRKAGFAVEQLQVRANAGSAARATRSGWGGGPEGRPLLPR